MPESAKKMLRLLEDQVLSPKRLIEMGVSHPASAYRRLSMHGYEIYRIRLSMGNTTGSIKYRKSKLLKPDTPTVVFYTDQNVLANYLRSVFRFDLNPKMGSSKKRAVTHYLRSRVPERTFKILRSLYV